MADPGLKPRVRFAPAPSGDLHVGTVRTALYNWLLARRHGGSFIFRVEDTDASRATDEAFHAAQDVLHWLGLDWDEGPGIGGPYAPYRQSERLAIYAEAATELIDNGQAYHCYCTPEELAARREQAAKEHRTPGYDGRCRHLTAAQIAGFAAEGRRPVVRFRMHEGATTFTDLIRGAITIDHKDIPDFTLTRSDGHPLYMLAATVDDVIMKMTHILRGEDLISATPRQLALYAALRHPEAEWPQFGHLPLIIGDDSKPLSKRNGDVSIAWYRGHGFTPEAMVNYLALLGWSMDGEHELFTLAEMVAAFSLERVSRNPARFDLKKLEAVNGEKIRGLTPVDLESRLLPILQEAGVVSDPLTPEQQRLLDGAIPLIQTRLVRLTEAPDLLRFLFEDELTIDHASAAKTLLGEVAPALVAARDALEELKEWQSPEIEATLRGVLVDGLGLKPKHAFGPLRVAITGRTVSPPLFESMELLGREKSLARLTDAIVDIRGF